MKLKYVLYVYWGKVLVSSEEELRTRYRAELRNAFVSKGYETDLVDAVVACGGSPTYRPSIACSAFLILPLFPYHQGLRLDLKEAIDPWERKLAPLKVISFTFGIERPPAGVAINTTHECYLPEKLSGIGRGDIEQVTQFVATRTIEHIAGAIKRLEVAVPA